MSHGSWSTFQYYSKKGSHTFLSPLLHCTVLYYHVLMEDLHTCMRVMCTRLFRSSLPVEKDAVCCVAVATSSAALLVVILHGLAEAVMDDEADIRLINAHAKCYGCYNHLQNTQKSNERIVGIVLSVTKRCIIIH